MKHGKKLTRRQKIFLSGIRLNPDNWLCVTDDIDKLIIIHKHTDNVRVIYKT